MCQLIAVIIAVLATLKVAESAPNIEGEVVGREKTATKQIGATLLQSGQIAEKMGSGTHISALDVGRWRMRDGQQSSTSLVEGTVVLVEQSHMTLTQRGKWTRFFVPDDAMIRVNSAEAPLQDVQPGHFAAVASRVRGEKLVAVSIDAKRQY